MQLLKWLYSVTRAKRWFALTLLGGLLAGIGLLEVLRTAGVVSVVTTSLRARGLSVALLGLVTMTYGLGRSIRSVVAALLPEHNGALADEVRRRRFLEKGPRVVVIGGGTGLSTLLRGLKSLTSNITAIVTVTDEGGSSGRLRTEMGVPPPGDIRNCLVALADKEPLMERLFQFRFGQPAYLRGHSLGNLLIAALTEICGDFEQAIKESSKVLAIRGRVLPSTLANVRVGAEMEDGSRLVGETSVVSSGKAICRVFLEPADCSPIPDAIEAIERAELIVLGPGSLFTSVIPNLLVRGVTDAICRSGAARVYICNVMTQPGETDGYSVSRHVEALRSHTGRNLMDYCVVNDGPISKDAEARYGEMGQSPVVDDSDRLRDAGITVIKAAVVSEREGVRHDPERLAGVLASLIEERRRSRHVAGGLLHRSVSGLIYRLASQYRAFTTVPTKLLAKSLRRHLARHRSSGGPSSPTGF